MIMFYENMIIPQSALGIHGWSRDQEILAVNWIPLNLIALKDSIRIACRIASRPSRNRDWWHPVPPHCREFVEVRLELFLLVWSAAARLSN